MSQNSSFEKMIRIRTQCALVFLFIDVLATLSSEQVTQSCQRIRCLLLQSELVFRKCKVCRIRLMVPSFFDIMFTPCLPKSFNIFNVVGIEGWVVTYKPSDKSCNKSSGILHSFLSDLKIAFCLQGDQSQTDVFWSSQTTCLRRHMVRLRSVGENNLNTRGSVIPDELTGIQKLRVRCDVSQLWTIFNQSMVFQCSMLRVFFELQTRTPHVLFDAIFDAQRLKDSKTLSFTHVYTASRAQGWPPGWCRLMSLRQVLPFAVMPTSKRWGLKGTRPDILLQRKLSSKRTATKKTRTWGVTHYSN